MAEGTVKRESSCCVRPPLPSPSPNNHMFLSAVDIMWRSIYYNQRVLFYSTTIAREEVSRRLKSSLAQVLTHFYPWAGRLVEDQGRLALACNDAGVEFIEASVDLPFASLLLLRDQPFFKELAPMRHWTSPALPLLFIQVTFCEDNAGFVLGVARNHVVADGHSFWHFMRSWGECARGLAISLKPVHTRTLLGPHRAALPPSPPKRGPPSTTFEVPTVDLAQRDFHFSASMVRKLKEAASLDAGAAGFSSFQVLCAHIWKHATLARLTREAGPTKSCILILADFRGRLHPPLPPSYFGNAVFWDVGRSTREELEAESLGATAIRVREVVGSLSDAYFGEALGTLEVLGAEEVLQQQGTDDAFVVKVASSPKFPVYDVEFGWGRPSCVRPPFIRGDGDVLLFQGPEEEGSVDVCIGLERSAMHRLGLRQRFTSY